MQAIYFAVFSSFIVDKAPTPIISKDENSNLVVRFTLPAIPFIPLEVRTVFNSENMTSKPVHTNVTNNSSEIEFSIGKEDVPLGMVSLHVSVKFQGDDHFSDLSSASNEICKKPPPFYYITMNHSCISLEQGSLEKWHILGVDL